MTVLVIAPHPDDESIGCGGSICLHAKRKDRVVAVFLTSGELGLKHLERTKAREMREREAEKAARILGLAELEFLRQPDWYLRYNVQKAAEALRPILRRERPSLIYLPHAREWHPDHRAAVRIVREALARGAVHPEMRGYEVWTPLERYDHVENISKVFSRKLRAVRAHRSQFGELDYAMAVTGLNQYRGALSGRCAFAEVFQYIAHAKREEPGRAKGQRTPRKKQG
jgi:LmbE family N-acetylglucosaminyl deacetylase